MSMRTPFNRVTGLGSAKEGTSHFWRQRLTAIANLPLMLFLVWFVIRIAGTERADMVLLLANPLIAGLMILTLLSVSWHMRIGMQVVIEDYVHGEGAKIALLVLNTFFCVAVAALGIISVLKLSFGG